MIAGVRFTNRRPPARKASCFPNLYHIMITGVRFTNRRPLARKASCFPNPYHIMITGVRFTNRRPPAQKASCFSNPYYIIFQCCTHHLFRVNYMKNAWAKKQPPLKTACFLKNGLILRISSVFATLFQLAQLIIV